MPKKHEEQPSHEDQNLLAFIDDQVQEEEDFNPFQEIDDYLLGEDEK